MSTSPIAAFRGPLRAVTAGLVTVSFLGAAASVAASTFLLGLLLYRVGGLLFHLSIAAARILVSVILPALILARALPGAIRIARV